MSPLALGFAVLIGLSLGMLGGGGSILTVPMLVYALGMDPKQAIATSLLVVAITSAAAMVSHARAGRVRWRTGVLFGAAGMLGAYVGGRLASFIPGTILLAAFAVMMLATGIAMLRRRRPPSKATYREIAVGRVMLDGIVVGLVTGLVGAGGGFLVVPALALLGGLPMSAAVGTSLLVIAMKSSAGFAGYLHSVPVDWTVGLSVAGVAVVGSWFGERLASRLSERALRAGFGVFVLGMASFMLLQQLPPSWSEGYRFWVTAAVTLALNGAVVALSLGTRRRSEAKPASMQRTDTRARELLGAVRSSQAPH